MLEQQTITVQTNGRATIEITREVEAVLRTVDITHGLCHVFVHHTSASLIVTENADDNVRRDLESYISRLVRDGDPAYRHDQEGPDDMAAHIRSVLTQTEITIPVQSGRLMFGTWQGLYLWEHRLQAHRRKLTVTISGMPGS
ncbi:MAG: secondary thiamine-phosphate synthase enzyme YjbQ [Gammaproteobacteria bacterium]|jgi:secondary thiamine-phosphate synthase enzyme|nr:secondary thiamine-phosphate synthase enzyme YjbQ [Gammaproteobacteria bacterium]